MSSGLGVLGLLRSYLPLFVKTWKFIQTNPIFCQSYPPTRANRLDHVSVHCCPAENPPKPSLSWPVACPSSEMAVVMVRGSREISIWFHFIITSLIWKQTKTTNFNYPARWGGAYSSPLCGFFWRISILTNDQQTLHLQQLFLTCRMSCERRAWQHRFGNALILRGLRRCHHHGIAGQICM